MTCGETGAGYDPAVHSDVSCTPAFVYCLTVAGGILDGWPGLYYAFQRAIAEAMLSLALIERKLTAADRTGIV